MIMINVYIEIFMDTLKLFITGYENKVFIVVTTSFLLFVFSSKIMAQDSTVEINFAECAIFDLKIYKPLALSSGNEEQISDNTELSVGAMAFVNLDNDDNDNKYDIEDDNIENAADGITSDDDLAKIEISYSVDEPVSAEIILEAESGGQNIRIWKSSGKNEEYDLGESIQLILNEGNEFELELWIEGIQPCTSQQEIILKASLVGNTGIEDKVALTVVGVECINILGQNNGFTPGSDNHDSPNLDVDPNYPTNIPVTAFRVFAGARSNNYDLSRNTVLIEINLTVNPLENLKFYLKSFDIDDPSSETNFIDPNDKTNQGSSGFYSGTGTAISIVPAISFTPEEDNRGENKTGILEGQDSDGISEITFSSTESTKTQIFTTSTSPGDNYRIVANGSKSFLNQLRNLDTKDEHEVVNSLVTNMFGPKEILFPNNYASSVLTVWRILHVEEDSMMDFLWSQNQRAGIFTDFDGQQNKGTKTIEFHTIGSNGIFTDNSFDLDDGAMSQNGRFENGTLLIGETCEGDVCVHQTEFDNITGNGNFRVVFPKKSMAGLTFNIIDATETSLLSGIITEVLKDETTTLTYEWFLDVSSTEDLSEYGDKMINIGGGDYVSIISINNIDKTIKTNEFNLPYIIRDDDLQGQLPTPVILNDLNETFNPGYLLTVIDGGGNMSNNGENIPFIGNLASSEAHINIINPMRESKGNESDNFWIIHISSGFQGSEERDNDANMESPTTL